MVGTYLTRQREKAGVTRTAVAEQMMYPGGAVKAIEEGRREPKPATVVKYLEALETIKLHRAVMYNRINK